MRRFPPTAPISRTALLAGVLAASGVLLAGCGDLSFGGDEALGDLELPDLGAVLPSASPEAEEEKAAGDLPSTCAEAGAEELAGGYIPSGASLSEDDGAPEGAGEDARQLSCVWTGSGEGDGGAPVLALVFTLNADPADAAQVIQEAGGEKEANWEVDVDVYGDTYHSAEADELDGELEYLTTAAGNTRYVILTLPGDLHVTASALNTDVAQEDLEQLAVQAAQRVRE
ncbi:hypothetical protein [Nocardiopsis potens]|uniref:hypothetical protein n=1 Tax=Nocardiopsis potens TaxID=1246458 RepID=UPI0003482AA0|nr:hypothetical protein [Nocardiopsis potens]